MFKIIMYNEFDCELDNITFEKEKDIKNKLIEFIESVVVEEGDSFKIEKINQTT